MLGTGASLCPAFFVLWGCWKPAVARREGLAIGIGRRSGVGGGLLRGRLGGALGYKRVGVEIVGGGEPSIVLVEIEEGIGVLRDEVGLCLHAGEPGGSCLGVDGAA